jgi:xylose isomerase
MDVYAQGLIAADKIIEEGTLPSMIKNRYSSFNTPIGQKIEAGSCSFEELEKYALENEPKQISGQQELYEAILNRYIYK